MVCREFYGISTQTCNRRNICIKKLSNHISLIKLYVKYDQVIFFMHTFMRLCKFVWIYVAGCRSRTEIYSGIEQRDQLQLYSHYSFRTQNVRPKLARQPINVSLARKYGSCTLDTKMLTARKKGVVINKITPNMFINYRVLFCNAASVFRSSVQEP